MMAATGSVVLANLAVMVQVWTFAVLMVVLVGPAVLPRRAAQPREGFPWFWLAFPMAVLLVAGSLHMWLPGISAASGWTRYMPLADRRGGVQFLGNEQFWQLQAFLLGRWILPIAALVLVGLSVWSWRRGRIRVATWRRLGERAGVRIVVAHIIGTYLSGVSSAAITAGYLR